MASYIIGVDVGYGNTKTAHSCFSSGIKLLSSKPPISTRVIETTSGFYTIGNGKLSIQSSKTEDENMRALTMAGIAEELKRTHTTVADVYLGCGVPLTRMVSEMQFYVTQNHGTEPPFTGRLLHNKRDGVYHCLICDAPLFHSQTKYDSGCGWPSFYEPVSEESIRYIKDLSHGMQRIEIRCGNAMSIWAMSSLTGRSQRANVIVLTLLLYASLMAKTAKKSTVEKTIQQLIPQERKNYES